MSRAGGEGGPGAEVPSGNGEAALLAVNCFDIPHPHDSRAYWKALAPAGKAAGRYGASDVTSSLTCEGRPTTTQKPHRVSAEGVAPVHEAGHWWQWQPCHRRFPVVTDCSPHYVDT